MTAPDAPAGVRIRFCRLSTATSDVPLPRYMSAAAAGMDVAAAVETPMVLQPGERTLIPTGFCMEIPRGYEAQIRPRSGLALKHGIMVLNTPGTIDADYRGEVKIILANLGQEQATIHRGDRIAQMIIAPIVQAHIEVVQDKADLAPTPRDTGGFGSTGQ